MATFSDSDLWALDEHFAVAGVPFHARPLRAAIEILGDQFRMGVHSNPEVNEICQAYERLIPETKNTWPGMGTGLVASLDRVRTIKVGVGYGSVRITPHQCLDFESHEQWLNWCRGNSDIAAKSFFAFTDIFDLVYGVNDFRSGSNSANSQLWELSVSHLAVAAHALAQTGAQVDSLTQSICLASELAMKGSLLKLGVPEKELRSRDKFGHKLGALAERMSTERPHRDDGLLIKAAHHMPDLVDSRYEAANLSRLQLVKHALNAQFIAASSVRRMTTRDLSGQAEGEQWPGAREPLFT